MLACAPDVGVWLRRNAMFRRSLLIVCAASALAATEVRAQMLTGTIVGAVRDEQGASIPEASIRLSSPSIIGGRAETSPDAHGGFRFQALLPGDYRLEVDAPGFARWQETTIVIGVGQTIERRVVLGLAPISAAMVIEGRGSRLDARMSGFETRFGREYLEGIPSRRFSLFDFLRVAPGVSPTSPTSVLDDRVSAFGSSTNENVFLIDGSNFTCPCSGFALAEPGIDTIQEIQIRSVGASAEFGNAQGAVFNVVTRQGGNRFQSELSYYAQPAVLTSRPVVLDCPDCSGGQSGYARDRYHDLTANTGGPVVRDRFWFFAGAQYRFDGDSQPGANPAFPRTYELTNVSWKVTWQATRGLRAVHAFSDQFSVAPERPTLVLPFETTVRVKTRVPTSMFANVTHVLSRTTLWDAQVGRMVFSQTSAPSAGDGEVANRFDRATGVSSGGPSTIGHQVRMRTSGKATMTHIARLAAIAHEWKFGVQVERGEHFLSNRVPTGVRYEDNRGERFQSVSRDPVVTGGAFVTAGVFISDSLTLGTRTIVNAGVRFDHSRAFSQDVYERDVTGRETGRVVAGLGPLYTWNLFSPRLGITARLTENAATVLRASYGRFHQGVLTAELQSVHPGVTPITTKGFDPATGDYTRLVSTVDPRINVRLDSETRSPRTEQFSVSVERELGRSYVVSTAFVHKDGRDFTGWTDTGGAYREELRRLPDDRIVPVFVLTNSPSDRRFLLTNPADYSLTYNGLAVVLEKRASGIWQAFASYTLSRTAGLLLSSGNGAAAAQVSSSIGPSTAAFGRDPNSLTNARGLLPGDRPHMVRVMGTLTVPGTGAVIAGNLQYYSGTPWTASADVDASVGQGPQRLVRVLLEPRGTRRLPSQALLDVRVSRSFRWGRDRGRSELLLDVLNVLDNTAVEGLATDDLFSPNFAQPTVFVDPRRVMVGVRTTFGR